MNQEQKPDPQIPPVLAPKLSKVGQRWFDRLSAYYIPPQRVDEEVNWVQDADWARLRQDPLRARFLLRWVGLLVLVFLIWASLPI